MLHAGEYTSPFVIAKFKMLNCRLIGVFGKRDGDHELLKKRSAETQNCEVHCRFAEANDEGFKITLHHGDEMELQNALIHHGGFDCVVSWHTQARRRSKGKDAGSLPQRSLRIVVLKTLDGADRFAETGSNNRRILNVSLLLPGTVLCPPNRSSA